MVTTTTDRLYGESSGVAVKAPVIAVATTALALSGLTPVGSYTPNEGDRILVTAQADATANGIYNASASAWQRSGDFDGNYDCVQGTLVIAFLQNGQSLAYQLTTENPAIGTSALNFVPYWLPSQTWPQNSAEATLGIVPVNYQYYYGNALRYGCDPTGQNDSTQAAQNTIDVMQVNCGTAYFPGATASYLCTSPLNITAGVSIVGDGWSPYTPNDFGDRGPGSWLQFNHLGYGLNIANASADVTSVFIEKIGTFRNQPAPGAGWAPIAANYDIFLGDGDLHVRDVMLLNPTKGLQINSASGARFDIDGLFGQPLLVGIDCYLAEDVCRIRNVHFWPYWENDSTYVNPYTQANLVALQFERCDSPMVEDFFCIFAKNGLVFTSNANGYTSLALLKNVVSDTMGGDAITVLAGANGTSFELSGFYGSSENTPCNGVSCYANNCLLQVSGAHLVNVGYCASAINGTGNTVQYTDWIVSGYNGQNNSSPCFYTNTGNQTIINGKVIATATNAAPLINSAATTCYNAVAAQGSFTITSATSLVITHGLGWEPELYQIDLYCGSSLGGVSLWVSNITTTQFTINASSAVSVSGVWTIDGRTS